MWELRWVLAGLGALVLVGVYLASKGMFRRAPERRGALRGGRQEPSIDAPEKPQADLRRAAPEEYVELDVDELEAAVELATQGESPVVEHAKPGTKKKPR